jgi:1,4-dihydroxy-2-naphthoate octaprenyltransferase
MSIGQLAISRWITVARLPFTTVAILPFAAGIFIAHNSFDSIHWPASLLGLVAFLLICVTCYLFGEVYDQVEDRLTLQYGRTRFSGGTLLVANHTLSPQSIQKTAVVLFSLAGIMGLIIAWIHGNGLLLALGAAGGTAAVLYSLPPVRLVERGLGEIFIAICYGWLPFVTGFASATGEFPPYSYFFVIPQSLSIFNVILINEFPDYEPDKIAGKRNLVVRTSREFASKLYAAAAVLVAVTTLSVWHVFRGGSVGYLLAAAPVVTLSLFLAWKVGYQERWREIRTLEPICGLGILLNHLVSVTLAILVVF